MKRVGALTISILISFFSYGQNHFNGELGFPLKIPIALSGNFGEIRSDHFHSGIDIKTQGQTGKPVYAVADGYIFRINVSTGGFGKALYIMHDQNYRSAYAHLSRFTDEVEALVKKLQYERRSYTIQTYPSKEVFPVQKGQLIGYSGNTGGSMGPHLHFEFRNPRSKPLNVLSIKKYLNDDRKPVIRGLYLYSKRGIKEDYYFKAVHPELMKEGYRLDSGKVLSVPGEFTTGIETYDYLNGSNNKCGVHSIKVYLDEDLCFFRETDQFSFDESRFINSQIDYREYERNRKQIQKSYIAPNNPLSINKFSKNKGIILLNDYKVHTIKYELTDVHGNKENLEFQVALNDSIDFDRDLHQMDYRKVLYWDKKNQFKDYNIELDFPEECFYEDVYFNYSQTHIPEKGTIHHVNSRFTPVHKYFTIKIKAENLPAGLEDKSLLAMLDEDHDTIMLGGSYKGGWIETKTRNFGDYIVTIDSIPPVIKPKNFKKGQSFKDLNKMVFEIYDNETGISEYQAKIDGKWVLFESEPKQKIIWHTFDSGKTDFGKDHELILEVRDGKDNRSTYTLKFFK